MVVHFFEQPLPRCTHGLAGWTAVVSRLEEGRQLFRRESELDRVSDEQQLRNRIS
jgi:hypothetical protein